MAKIRNLEEYCFLLGDVNLDKVRELHKTVGEFRESFLKNHLLQNVLLNKGYKVEDKDMPTSYLTQIDATYNRTRTLVHLMVLENLIELVTIPQLAIIKTGIIIPGREQDTGIKTPQGVSLENLEEFKKDWIKNEKVVETIREYQKTLNLAFDEYNMQFILGRMNESKRHAPLYGDQWEKERALQDRVERVTDSKSFTILGRAYYNMGAHFFRDAGPLHKELSKDKFGKKFLTSRDEELKFITYFMTNFTSSDELE